MRKRSKIIIICVLFVSILFSYKYSHSIVSTDSLEKVIDTTTNEILKVETINKLCYLLLDNDIIKAQKYNEIAYDLIPIVKPNKVIAEIYYTTGIINKTLGNYDSVMTNISKALAIYENIGDVTNQCRCLRNIGDLHRALGNFEETIKYTKQSLTIAKSSEDITLIASSLNRLSAIYFETDSIQKSKEMALESLKISEQIENFPMSANNYNILGAISTKLGNYDEAIKFLNESLEITKDDIISIPNILNNIAHVYQKKKEYNKALKYAMRSLKIAQETGTKIYISVASSLLSTTYEEMGDYKNAFKYLTIYEQTRFGMFDETKTKQIAQLQEKYEAEKREEINSKLLIENQLIESIIIQQRVIGGAMVLILIVVSIFARILYNRKRKIEIAQALLSEKNEEIEEQSEEIELQNERLIEMNKTKDKFFSVVSHDLKSPFSALLGLSDLLNEEFDDFSHEEKKKFIKAMRDSVYNIFQFINSLLEWSQIQIGKTPFKPIQYELNPSIHTIFGVLEVQAKNKDIELINKIQRNTSIFADYNMIETTIRNIVSNAIKFSNRGGFVELSSQKKDNYYEISIKDNGVGLREEEMLKLFTINESYKMPGTENEIGTGLGLILCKEFVNKNDGKIWVESEIDKGSTFKFTVPASEVEL